MVCVCALCECVWGLSRWTMGQYGRSGVITETRVSKLRGLIPETWHFQVALIQGYHINLTLLLECPPGRKWVEGHDLESKSQMLLGTAHREWQGKLQSPNFGMPDGSKIWVDGWWKSLKTCVLSQPPPQERETDTQVTGQLLQGDHTPLQTIFPSAFIMQKSFFIFHLNPETGKMLKKEKGDTLVN